MIDNNNRVKLMPDAGIPGSDYINASYVSVSRKSLTFLLYLFYGRIESQKITCKKNRILILISFTTAVTTMALFKSLLQH